MAASNNSFRNTVARPSALPEKRPGPAASFAPDKHPHSLVSTQQKGYIAGIITSRPRIVMTSILTEKEPRAFGERNPDGLSPILFISDHHRNRVPASLDNLGLPDEERARHIGYDIGISWVADYLSDRFDAPLVHTNYSRLVIDCNRQPGTPDASPVVADGTRVPGNVDLSKAALDARRTELFEPYHAAIRARMDAMEAAGRTPLFVALHSFTPMMKDSDTPRPWEIGIIWNKDDRLAVPIIEACGGTGI